MERNMDKKHTIGTWNVVGASIVEAATRNTIAVCVTGDRSIPTIDANARLIAAAPDLLAALESLANMVSAFPSELNDKHPNVIAARQAIAKATD